MTHPGSLKLMRILCAPAPGRIVIAVLPPGFVTPGALIARHVGVAPSIVNNNPETNGADDRFPQPQVVLFPGAALSQPKSDLSDFG
jgi:hypothetical protein